MYGIVVDLQRPSVTMRGCVLEILTGIVESNLQWVEKEAEEEGIENWLSLFFSKKRSITNYILFFFFIITTLNMASTKRAYKLRILFCYWLGFGVHAFYPRDFDIIILQFFIVWFFSSEKVGLHLIRLFGRFGLLTLIAFQRNS